MLKRFGVLILLLPLLVAAQNQATTETQISFESAIQKDDIVEVTLSSNTNFIVGANRYVLHSGAKYFLMNTHPGGDVTKITFFIPIDEFGIINGSSDLVLVYGLYDSNTKQDGESQQIVGFEGLHWKVNGVVSLKTAENE
ncbi:MAG: hypothetical protein MK078_08170 [Crocinitomicaceae bacterium]|nr:hypothetical protein [Crocinitomicaceae bacterium]